MIAISIIIKLGHNNMHIASYICIGIHYNISCMIIVYRILLFNIVVSRNYYDTVSCTCLFSIMQ